MSRIRATIGWMSSARRVCSCGPGGGASRMARRSLRRARRRVRRGSRGLGRGSFRARCMSRSMSLRVLRRGMYVGDTGDNLVTKFDASGNLISSWGDSSPANGQLSGHTSPPGAFTRSSSAVAGIAIDPTGDLWVYNTNGGDLWQYAQDGTFVSSPGTPGTSGEVGMAIGSTGNLYTDCNFGDCFYNDDLEVFNQSGNDEGTVTGSDVTMITGLAEDPSNDQAYVDNNGTQVQQYTAGCISSCATTATFGAGQLSGAHWARGRPREQIGVCRRHRQSSDRRVLARDPAGCRDRSGERYHAHRRDAERDRQPRRGGAHRLPLRITSAPRATTRRPRTPTAPARRWRARARRRGRARCR